jgi:hypothetical protein
VQLLLRDEGQLAPQLQPRLIPQRTQCIWTQLVARLKPPCKTQLSRASSARVQPIAQLVHRSESHFRRSSSACAAAQATARSVACRRARSIASRISCHGVMRPGHRRHRLDCLFAVEAGKQTTEQTKRRARHNRCRYSCLSSNCRCERVEATTDTQGLQCEPQSSLEPVAHEPGTVRRHQHAWDQLHSTSRR